MGRNEEGRNRYKKSEQYEGDTEREIEDKDEEGGQDHPAEYKEQSKKVAHAKDNKVKGRYLPYAEREEIYDKVDDGDDDVEGEDDDGNVYLPKVDVSRPKLSTLAKARNRK